MKVKNQRQVHLEQYGMAEPKSWFHVWSSQFHEKHNFFALLPKLISLYQDCDDRERGVRIYYSMSVSMSNVTMVSLR